MGFLHLKAGKQRKKLEDVHESKLHFQASWRKKRNLKGNSANWTEKSTKDSSSQKRRTGCWTTKQTRRSDRMNTTKNKTSVINDPLGQTHSLPVANNLFASNLFYIKKWGRTNGHVRKQLSLPAVTVGRPRGSKVCWPTTATWVRACLFTTTWKLQGVEYNVGKVLQPIHFNVKSCSLKCI